ncbi:concanavalin A-like lectin/glucanase [Gigaspora margarita]|uniref:Concanavalin A-like lectin/glucanase n=1 Tax=Gigaspora margarita TaxID=4874 RepID=A0A8H4B3U0_GIGMA|nr:concanavalin A-like lectin/glucanase [Gigaspora margarita]
MIMNYYYFYYLIIIIFSNSISVFCQKQEPRIYRELITEPTIFTPEYNRVISHAELPVVKNELSITLKISLARHSLGPGWDIVFYKGRTENSRTPALWLNPNNSAPCPRFSTTGNHDKRMNFYIDGEWVGSSSVAHVRQSIKFNDSPLYIGSNLSWCGFAGQISNFRYYNFRLSHSEVLMDYSGEDLTNHNDNDECLNKSFVDLTIAFFLGIMVMVLAGILFIPKIILRRSYQEIPNPMQ